MSKVAIATLQPVWDCRWSRPGYRVVGVEDHLQPESRWVCVREERRNVTETECEDCPHWQERPTY